MYRNLFKRTRAEANPRTLDQRILGLWVVDHYVGHESQ